MNARERMLQDLALSERTVVAAGAATTVLEAGHGPPLLLLHGGIECGSAFWAPVVAPLAASHRLVMPDLPGLGESEPVTRLDSATFRDWLRDVLHETCDEPPVLIAHSLSGGLAARFAASGGEHLRRLVVYASPGIGPFRIPLGLKLDAIRFAIRPTERNDERMGRRALHDLDAVRDRDPGWFAAFITYNCERARVTHVKRTMRALIGDGTKQVPDAELRRIDVPVELVWGRHDRFVPLSVGTDASTRLGWPLQVIEDCGHAPHIERPGAFLSAVLEPALGRSA